MVSPELHLMESSAAISALALISPTAGGGGIARGAERSPDQRTRGRAHPPRPGSPRRFQPARGTSRHRPWTTLEGAFPVSGKGTDEDQGLTEDKPGIVL